ncbi:hypothetical protein EVAR_34204_1 [Eumeta japonica]|uniref:Uncharacterized protein n=1 Tax=Eumeta variegata TaxID=151549 RepID=A0A4C1WGY4_EUMVA|nr:hypothetical protein EVAR_34204_1 [Eumeta japonica]
MKINLVEVGLRAGAGADRHADVTRDVTMFVRAQPIRRRRTARWFMFTVRFGLTAAHAGPVRVRGRRRPSSPLRWHSAGLKA